MLAHVEALRRAIVDGGDDRTPAAAIRQAVLDGESAESCMQQLVDAYRATLSDSARADLALAITVDLLRRGDAARWIAVRGPSRHELDNALLEADKFLDVRAAIFALASNPHATSTVCIWWRRNPEQRTTEPVTNLTDEGVLHVVRELHIREQHALFVPRLAAILSHARDATLRSGAAFQLLCAANLGCDIGSARDALRSALDADSTYYGTASLAAHALARIGEPGLDRDPRAAVRMGFARARSSFLALLDPDPANRLRIARDLLDAMQKDTNMCPSPDELHILLGAQGDLIIAEVVYGLLERGEVAAVVAKLEPRGMTRHLVTAAEAVLAHAPPPLCRTCRNIPRHVSESDDEPHGLKGNACGECGAAYEYDSYTMDDIYGSYRRTYTRLPPTIRPRSHVGATGSIIPSCGRVAMRHGSSRVMPSRTTTTPRSKC